MIEQDEPIYREVQRLSAWIFAIVALSMPCSIVVLALVPLTEEFPIPRLLFVIIVAVVMPMMLILFLAAVKLETEVRRDGLYVRFFPLLLRFRRFAPEEIEQYFARKYHPLVEYGGWGIRLGINGRAYNAKGNQGVQLVLQDGKRVLIGSQKPDALVNALGLICGPTK